MGIIRCVVPIATQIFLVLILAYFGRLDGYQIPCTASNINCKSNTNHPTYENARIKETFGDSIEFLRSSMLKLRSRLTKSKSHEYLDETGFYENLLEKSPEILQVASKSKITKKEETQELEVPKVLSTETLEVSRDISLRTRESYLEGLKNDQNMVQKDHWLKKNQRKRDSAAKLPTKRRGLAKNIGNLAEDQIKHNLHTMFEKWRMLAERQLPVTTKEKITENKEKTHELGIQKEVGTEISEYSGDISMRSKSPLEWLKSHQQLIQHQELGKKQTEDLFLTLPTKMGKYADNTGKHQAKQVKHPSYIIPQQWWKPARRHVTMKVNKWPQEKPKLKLKEKREKSHQLEIQQDMTNRNAEDSGEINLRTISLEGLKGHQKIAQKVHLVAKNIKEDFFLQLVRKRQRLETTTGTRTGQQIKPAPHKMNEKWRKDAMQLVPLKKTKRPQVTTTSKFTEIKEKTHELESKTEVPTQIPGPLKIKKWLEVTLKEKERKIPDLEIQNEMARDISEPLLVKRWPKVPLKEKIKGNGDKTNNLESQKEVATESSELQNIKKWPKVIVREKLRQNKEKTDVMEMQKKLTGETLKVKSRWKLALEENIRENKEKTQKLESQKEVATKIIEPLKVKRWSKVPFRKQIKGNKDKTHTSQKAEDSGEINLRTISLKRLKSHPKISQEVHVVAKNIREDFFLQLVRKRRRLETITGTRSGEQIKPAPHKMNEKWRKDANIKKWPKRILQEKLRQNKEKTDVIEMQKELSGESSEILKVKSRWKLALKEKIRENKEKTQKLESQKEVATKIIEPLKVKRWSKVPFRKQIKGNKDKTHTSQKAEDSGEINLRTISLKRLKSHPKIAQEVHVVAKNIREDFFLQLVRKRRRLETITGTRSGEQIKPAPHKMNEKWRKDANIKKWPKMILRKQLRQNKEKTDVLEMQREVTGEISEILKVKSRRKLALEEKLRGNREKTDKIESQVATEIKPLKLKKWPKVTLNEKLKEKEKTDFLEMEREITGDISETLKRWLKATLKEKLKENKKKIHDLEKEMTRDISKSMKVKRWPKVFPKEKKSEKRQKMNELEIQKVATDISPALKDKRWLKATIKQKIRENKLKSHELGSQKEVALEISRPLKFKRWLKVTLKEFPLWPHVAPKANIIDNVEKKDDLEIQKETASDISEAFRDIRLSSQQKQEDLQKLLGDLHQNEEN
ncbi:golgin subfamily A member 6-like protein 24 [Erythrolamprus reginae]|uniref:golgin subfamily A member 6-like protein 24 n=1 Tax=Erythrolamprus reginae TaxID=121349 RepID=UPI00396CCF91